MLQDPSHIINDEGRYNDIIEEEEDYIIDDEDCEDCEYCRMLYLQQLHAHQQEMPTGLTNYYPEMRPIQ